MMDVYGVNEGHAGEFEHHISTIHNMELEKYYHPLRIVVCNYDFDDKPVVWVDNLHSAILYMRMLGRHVMLKQLRFYVIDLTKSDTVKVINYKDSLHDNYKDIVGAVQCAYQRKKRSDSKKLIDLNYTVDDFISSNPKLLIEKNPRIIVF